MVTVKIDISDHQAANLTQKAAEQGLTLESWFQQVAERELTTKHSASPSVVDEMRKPRR